MSKAWRPIDDWMADREEDRFDALDGWGSCSWPLQGRLPLDDLADEEEES